MHDQRRPRVFDFETAKPWRVTALDQESEPPHAPLVQSTSFSSSRSTRRTALRSSRGTRKPTSRSRKKEDKGSVREVHLPVITEAEAAAVWRVFGMDERGHCPLPGHDGGAVLRANDDKEGELELRCDCLGAELKWGDVPFSEHDYSLADVYFSMRSGTVLDR
jgi:hypothetical protein